MTVCETMIRDIEEDPILLKRLTRDYLLRRRDELEEVIDRVGVFTKRWSRATDELEEVEELLGLD
jgi:hypothetical protein